MADQHRTFVGKNTTYEVVVPEDALEEMKKRSIDFWAEVNKALTKDDNENQSTQGQGTGN